MASRKKTVRKSKARRAREPKEKLQIDPPLPPDQRPLQIVYITHQYLSDTRRRRFFIALQLALSQFSSDDMDKIEPILRDGIGRATIKSHGSMQGYAF